MKHTAGPWKVTSEEDHNEYSGTSSRYVTGVSSPQGIICEFADDYGTDQSANARLIAKSPAMDDAIRMALEDWDSRGQVTQASINKLREATGETQ